MRVAVCSDGIGALGPAVTSVAVARAFAERGCHVAVVPIGAARGGAAAALADLVDAEHTELTALATPAGAVAVSSSSTAGDVVVVVESDAPDRPDLSGSSAPLGAVLGSLGPVGRLWIDPGPVAWHDGGAGLLEALGGSDAARQRFTGTEIVLLVPDDEATRPLTGLRGLTSVVRRAEGDDVARLLATDQRLADVAAALGIDPDEPGTGARGGLGAAVRALGGRILTGPQACAELAGLAATIAAADLVVTGCDRFDFGTFGGGAVTHVATLAEASQTPVIVVAGHNHVSARELRTFGVESGHSLAATAGETPDAAAITAAVAPIAASWVR